MSKDVPSDFLLQIEKIKKYVIFKNEKSILPYLHNIGYYRLSRYGKNLLRATNSKQPLYVLLDLYNFDKNLRLLLFEYCKKIEIKLKSYISNYISLEYLSADFYLNKECYTNTKGERNKFKRNKNKEKFERFFRDLENKENEMRKRVDLYPDFSIYGNLGERNGMKIPSWAFFNYIEFGTIVTLYSYLNLKYKKIILKNKYPLINSTTGSNYLYSWLKRVNLIRNYCDHHNMIIYKNMFQLERDTLNEKENLLESTQDLFSSLYVLRKILTEEESIKLYKELKELIKKSKIDVMKYKVLPEDWKEKYFKITVVHI